MPSERSADPMANGDVRSWHEADVAWARRHVRFQGKADMTRTGCHFRVRPTTDLAGPLAWPPRGPTRRQHGGAAPEPRYCLWSARWPAWSGGCRRIIAARRRRSGLRGRRRCAGTSAGCAILRPGERRRALQPAPKIFRCQAFAPPRTRLLPCRFLPCRRDRSRDVSVQIATRACR